MQQAADRQGVSVNQISFIDALRWLKSAREGDQLSDLVVLPNDGVKRKFQRGFQVIDFDGCIGCRDGEYKSMA